MRRLGALASALALGAALISSSPALARGGFHGGFGGFHGGFGGFHGGWGGGWHGGWNRWGWNRGWNNGWGWGAAGLGLGLGLAGLGYDYDYGYPYDYAWDYGYPYNYYPYNSYGYGYGYGAPYVAAAPVTAPVVTGRSVAVSGGLGNYCTTSVKTCLLYHSAYLGDGCSCRVPGGHARGQVLH